MEPKLFEECLQKLSNKAQVLSSIETEKIELVLQRVFPFIVSNIDWPKTKTYQPLDVDRPDQIVSVLGKLLHKTTFDKAIYIIWDSNNPAIKTDLDTAITCFDDITSIGTRTWLFNPDIGFVVEWHWCGQKTIGIAHSERVSLGKMLYECLASLGNECNILSVDQSKQVFKALKNKFGFKHLLVDWNIITSQQIVNYPADIIPQLQQLVPGLIKPIYLMWHEVEHLPLIETNLNLAIENWNKIMSAAHLMYICDQNFQYIIELRGEQLLIGTPPHRHQVR